MTAGLKQKFDLVLSREQRLARSIALAVVRPKPFSVWEVLIPLVFIFGYMRAKEEREVFAQNLLFTKKTALEAAYEMLRSGQSRQAVLSAVKSKTDHLLATAPQGIYSEDIRREQLLEIDLLIDHYRKLILAEGQDYPSLVVAAYGTKTTFATFQQKLQSAETRVAEAAARTLGQRADFEMAARIAAAAERFRQAEIEQIFKSM